MEKTAYELGQMAAFQEYGLEKVAIWSAIGKGLQAFGRLGSKTKAFGTRMSAKGGPFYKNFGGVTRFTGNKMLNATGALGSGMTALRAAPMKTLGSGALNMGKGALFFGGKGIGGGIGKGIGAYGMGSMVFGGGGQAPTGQQAMYPQGGYGRQYGG